MSQVRLWKVARTESEIANNMYFEVNPKNPNLIALGQWMKEMALPLEMLQETDTMQHLMVHFKGGNIISDLINKMF